MKVWICDSCGKELSSEETHLKTWLKKWVEEDLDLCKGCLEIYNKAEDEINLEREKIIEEYRTKCYEEIENREKEILCKYKIGG